MDTVYFSISGWLVAVWWSLGAMALAMVWLLTFYRGRLAKIIKTGKNQAVEASDPSEGAPKEAVDVSVIVYAEDNAQGLMRMLPSVLAQEYAGRMEVIVINDGSCSDVADVVKMLQGAHKNLYLTFVPDEAHNLSRKKLAISLGVKAAKYPYVVITSANCEIPSARWLTLMAAPFAAGKQVSLGVSRLANLRGAMNRFDEAEATAVWLSSALAGHPYRGDGHNIGYATELFFRVKGFSKSLTLHNGDDDIFISRIATPENTGVVVNPDAIVTIDSAMSERLLRESRINHCFTGRFITRTPSALFGASTLMLWALIAASVAGVVWSLPNALPACIILAAWIGLRLPLAMAWKGVCRTLGIRVSAWALPWLMTWRWVRSMRYRMVCGRPSRKNYTWLQH